MGENPTEATKTCAACGADVTSSPRVKDAKGRYFCRACAAKKQAELSKKVGQSAGPGAALAPAGGDADIMSRLVDDSIAKGAVSCPACRRPWKEGAVICTGCGFNKQTGQVVGTQIKQPELIKDPKAPKAKKVGSGGKKFAGAHWKVALILGLLFAGGLALSAVNKEFAPVFSFAVMGYLTVLPFFAAFDAYTSSESALKAAAVFFCGLYMLYYCAVETENDLLKGSAWAYLIILLLFVVGVFALGMAIGAGAGFQGIGNGS
jgi:hypothetical protein